MAIVEVYPNPFSTTTSSPSFCSYHHHNPNPFSTSPSHPIYSSPPPTHYPSHPNSSPPPPHYPSFLKPWGKLRCQDGYH